LHGSEQPSHWHTFKRILVCQQQRGVVTVMAHYLYRLETEENASKNMWLAFPEAPINLPEQRRREQVRNYITCADQHPPDRFYTGASKNLFWVLWWCKVPRNV